MGIARISNLPDAPASVMPAALAGMKIPPCKQGEANDNARRFREFFPCTECAKALSDFQGVSCVIKSVFIEKVEIYLKMSFFLFV